MVNETAGKCATPKNGNLNKAKITPIYLRVWEITWTNYLVVVGGVSSWCVFGGALSRLIRKGNCGKAVDGVTRKNEYGLYCFIDPKMG